MTTFNKVLILSLIVSISASSLHAQTGTTTTTTTTSGTQQGTNSGASDGASGSTPLFAVGFRYMPTFSSFQIVQANNNTLETSLTLGHGFGAVLAYNMTNTTAFQAEIIYSSLAQKYVDNSVENTITLDYINIPLLLSLNSGITNSVNLNFVIGPQFGLNVGSSVRASGNGNGTSTVNGVLAVKAGDVGFAYGAGLDFGTAPLRFNVGFRGVYGLFDISDKSTSSSTDQYLILDRSHVKTYAAYIGITYFL